MRSNVNLWYFRAFKRKNLGETRYKGNKRSYAHRWLGIMDCDLWNDSVQWISWARSWRPSLREEETKTTFEEIPILIGGALFGSAQEGRGKGNCVHLYSGVHTCNQLFGKHLVNCQQCFTLNKENVREKWQQKYNSSSLYISWGQGAWEKIMAVLVLLYYGTKQWPKNRHQARKFTVFSL